ncbi:YeeE/YedE family protein [Neotamlana laminarinivorans]|uniref:YeeE/YedE family protein n=1 Tax=Neotamlana laminarinivorans TaxID=2883124 RepID=A0A9X1HYY3_9FLAO|nr:YeeE/YedE thiosulfate transporter family protein [Tamlana laminarinivorans]MCB4797870.1 YeeE/YedE family protein [Tamlana laminarinivorans]
MDIIFQPWPWYISGPLIAIGMFLLLLAGKTFGMSSNLKTMCSILGAGKKVKFFQYDWTAYKWNLVVVLGTIIGGFIAANLLSSNLNVNISPASVAELNSLGFKSAGKAYLPTELFNLSALKDIKTLIILAIGGVLIGFGTRYAGGCTSGHAITGLSNLQLPSLIAVIGFFVGGLIMINLIFPLIF